MAEEIVIYFLSIKFKKILNIRKTMDELEQLREKRKQQLLKQIEQRIKQQEMENRLKEEEKLKRKQLLNAILQPDALPYLETVRGSNPETAKKIEDTLLYLFLQGQLINKVDALGIKYIRRKLEKKEPVIKIARRGEEPIVLGKK